MEIKPEHLEQLWYEDKDRNWRLPDYTDNAPDPVDDGYIYQHSRFSTQLTQRILRVDIDDEGHRKSVDLGGFTSTYPDDLALAIANSGEYRLRDAITIAGTSCERCLNALCWHYEVTKDGEREGYPEGSEEWLKARTSCQFCES